MPDMIRVTGGSQMAHPRRGGFRMAAAATICITLASHCLAQEPARPDDIDSTSATMVGAYLNAFAQLDGHEFAALALTLGVLLFAVVTAIMLVRTRLRLAHAIE